MGGIQYSLGLNFKVGKPHAKALFVICTYRVVAQLPRANTQCQQGRRTLCSFGKLAMAKTRWGNESPT